MAKLSARGRTEIARFQRLVTSSRELPPDILRRSITYAFMSDGHVLKKYEALWTDGAKTINSWQDEGNLGLERFNTLISGLQERGFVRVK